VRHLLPGRAACRRHLQHQLRDRLRAEELYGLEPAALADQGGDDDRRLPDAAAVHLDADQGHSDGAREADRMTSEFITIFMFVTMLVLLFTGQRVFGVIGFVGSIAALWLWGKGSFEMPFNASFQVLNWYPLITVP